MTKQFTPSVLEQLKDISKTLQGLIDYEYDVVGDDMTDAIEYSRIKDVVDLKIKEIEK